MYFLNINKPKGITSFDVIKKLRQILKIKQIGHSGTLDPLASGVLQVAVGNAAKLLDYLSSDKEYIAQIIFGYVSETFDSEGGKKFIKEPDFTEDDLNSALKSFVGKTKQVPPKYSAIKINGRKLCDIARFDKDCEIEIKPREIEIFSIDLLKFDKNTAEIRVSAKKGTYIRSLVHDLGQKLGCGAYMSELTRVSAGDFKIENSDDIDSLNFNKISPFDALSLDIKELSDFEYEKILNGNFIEKKENFKTDFILLKKGNKLVSIAKISDNLIKPKKVFKGE